MGLRVKLFGQSSVSVDGRAIKLPNRRAAFILLANLLLRHDRTLSRARMAFTIWPDETEEHALAELRRYIYRLRKVLEAVAPPILIADDDTIALLAGGGLESDLADVEALADDPARAAELCALYDGDLLEEFYDEWIVPERARLRARFLAALERGIAFFRARRDLRAALTLAQRLLREEPAREDALRTLVAIRYELGDAAGAIAEFERFARYLADDLDATPMPETLALVETVRDGAPLRAALGLSRSAAAHPFVGRSSEFARLRAWWNQAKAGDGKFVLIEGEAGIGKSRLVAELALLAEADGARCLAGMATDPEERPYQAIVDALATSLPVVAAADMSAQTFAALAEVIPELRERRRGIAALDPLEPEAHSRRLRDAFATAILAVAEPRPLLLIFEDLHWAGAATFDALATLARRIAGRQILAIGIVREEEFAAGAPIGAFLSTSAGLGIRRLALGGLDETAADTLAQAFLDEPERLDRSAIAFTRSGGNPLYLIELLRAAGGDDPAERAPALPPAVRTLIGRRFARLSPEAQRFAHTAAVYGRDFELDFVRRIGGFSARDAEVALDELVDRAFVREVPAGARHGFAFAHHVVYEALYESIEPAERARRHRRIARALEAASLGVRGSAAVMIAYHYERGEEPSAAASAYAFAARDALNVFANVEARSLALRGLALHRDLDHVRFALLSTSIDVAMYAGDRASILRDLGELDIVAHALDDAARLAVLRYRIDVSSRFEDRAAELAAIEAFEAACIAGDHAEGMAFILAARARFELAGSNASDAIALALQARSAYAALGDEHGVVGALLCAGNAYADAGDPVRANEAANAALRKAESLGDARLRMRALRVAGRVAQAWQDHAAAAEVARATLELCLATGDRDAEAHAHYQIGTAAWGRWQLDAGIEHLQKAIDLFERTGSPRAAAATNNLAGLFVDAGVFGEAHRLLERAATVASEHGGLHDVLLHVACNRVESAWLQGDDDALAIALAAVASAGTGLHERRHVAVIALARARAARARGDAAESLAQIERAHTAFAAMDRRADTIDLATERALSLLVAGEPLAATHALDDADALAAANGIARQYPERYAFARACAAHGSGDVLGERRTLEEGATAIAVRASAIARVDVRAAYLEIGFIRAFARTAGGSLPPLDRCPIFAAGALGDTVPVDRASLVR